MKMKKILIAIIDLNLFSAFGQSLKHLIKPMRAIKLMTLTLLMAIGVVFPSAATAELEVGNQYFCTGVQKGIVGGIDGPRQLVRQRGYDSLLHIKSMDKVVVHIKGRGSKEYDIITQGKLYLESGIPFSWQDLLAEYTAYNTDYRGYPAARYWRITFDGETLTEVNHGKYAFVHISECEKI
jgi:hypothetical protein